MCYTISFMERKSEQYAARYKDILVSNPNLEILSQPWPLFYFVSGFDHPQLPIVRHDGIFLLEWGLIPSWILDSQSAKEIRTKTLNARSETAFHKPSFRQSIATQRGLLGVNGFYEWRSINKIKYPYFIQPKRESLFSLGCIYETWVDKITGEKKKTFSILTTIANPLMEKIHTIKKRMPLIISPQEEKRWINPDLPTAQIIELMKPYPEEEMEAFTVSQNINSVKNQRNIPSSIHKVEYLPLLLFDHG